MERIREAFERALAAALPGQDIVLERPKSGDMGDLAFPCFRVAKAVGKNPAALAQELAADQELVASVEKVGASIVATGPYLNLKLRPEVRAKVILGSLLSDRPYGAGVRNGKKVIVEYSSPNIAKLFTIGHLRSTMIGHGLVQVHRYLGFEVVRLNHLGDWGTQFGTLLAAYQWVPEDNKELEKPLVNLDSGRLFVEESSIEKRRTPLYRLFLLYTLFHAEEADHPELRDEARAWFRKLESGDPEARRLWKRFRDISLSEFQRIYDRLGVGFDTLEQGEAFYEAMLGDVLKRLDAAGLMVEGEGGAKIVDLSDVGIETPMIVQKGDGASIYATRDLAQVTYRKEAYTFDRCIYVIGGEQTLHMQQIFATMEKLDPWFKGRLVHTPFGLIRLPEGKMSTRKGNVIFLEDVLDEARERVAAVIEEKNPDLPDKARVAELLGMGAVLFFNAMNDRLKPITFEWDRVIALDGDTGPYVQYAHARIMSILRKGATDLSLSDDAHFDQHARPITPPDGDATAFIQYKQVNFSAIPFDDSNPEPVGLDSPFAQELLFELAGLPTAIRMAQEQLQLAPIARHLLQIARAFSAFYTHCPIYRGGFDDRNVQRWRLALCVATARALRQGLFLLGIQAPEEM
ncbi:MAG: arginine--tRNA ligase [Holophagaceae bacterium]|nr:arginine--tRNA ligase [Holophagaceae bacterium]